MNGQPLPVSALSTEPSVLDDRIKPIAGLAL
jgi:hypothetical protein